MAELEGSICSAEDKEENNIHPSNNHCSHGNRSETVVTTAGKESVPNHCGESLEIDDSLLSPTETDAEPCTNRLDCSNHHGNDSLLSPPSLRKDDSGISMEKSRNDSDASQNESEAAVVTTSISHISVSSDDVNNTSPIDSTVDNKPEGVFRLNASTSSVSVNDSDVDHTDSDHEQIRRTTRRCRYRRIADSTDSDDEDDAMARSSADNTQERSSSGDTRHHQGANLNDKSDSDSDMDSASDHEEESDAPKLKHKWYALNELRRREYGWTNRQVQETHFRVRVMSSLQMTQRLKQQCRLDSHEGCVNALHFNRIGTLLASGSDDLKIVLWNWARNRPALEYESGHRSNVFQAKFMPYSGDCHVVSCARDGQVRLAELSLTGRCKNTKKVAQHRGAAHKLALQHDSPHVLLSCGEDAVTYEIDLRQEKPNKMCITKENDRKVALYSIHSNPMNSFEYCVGGRDHFIRIYDTRMVSENENQGPVKKFCPHHLVNSDIKANVTCAVYNYNGTEILGTYNDEDIYLFDSSHSDGADFIHRYSGHRNNNTVKGVNFYGPHSEYIVSGSDCSNVFLWEKESEQIVQYFHADEGGVVNVLEPHPHAPILATSGLDHDVKIWAPTAEEPTDLDGLKQIIKRNKKERDEERSNEPEVIDGQMLWFLMSHLRRTARRQARHEAGDYTSTSDNSSSESEEEVDEEGPPDSMQCAPS